MNQPTIRTAVPDDAHPIAHVHVATWQTAYKGQLPDEMLQNLDVDRRRQGWEQIIERGRHGRHCGRSRRASCWLF